MVSRVERFLAARIACDGCGRLMREEFAWHRNRERLCGTCESAARNLNKINRLPKDAI